MRQSGKIVLCGVVSSLSLAVMLFSWVNVTTYAAPALAGIFLCVIAREINPKWAAASYIAVSFLTMLIAENEAKILFVFFFGYYPILKLSIDGSLPQNDGFIGFKPQPRGFFKFTVFRYAFKLLIFNAAVFCSYLILSRLFGFRMEEMGVFGQYGTAILLLSGNAVFLLYDKTLAMLLVLYERRLHPVIKKIFTKM